MPTYANTVPVMERHRFDGASLDRYFAPISMAIAAGCRCGSSIPATPIPTFFVSAEMSDGKRRDFVLRKKPPASWWPRPTRSTASSA